MDLQEGSHASFIQRKALWEDKGALTDLYLAMNNEGTVRSEKADI